MSSGKIFDDPMFSLTENSVGLSLSPGKISGDWIPFATSPACIPRRHVPGDSIPREHVAGERAIMSPGIAANVVLFTGWN
ncbi:hypothetical protein Tco_1442758 [Tanacetum coccineum]